TDCATPAFELDPLRRARQNDRPKLGLLPVLDHQLALGGVATRSRAQKVLDHPRSSSIRPRARVPAKRSVQPTGELTLRVSVEHPRLFGGVRARARARSPTPALGVVATWARDPDRERDERQIGDVL